MLFKEIIPVSFSEPHETHKYNLWAKCGVPEH
jgi:hypothetical protein